MPSRFASPAESHIESSKQEKKEIPTFKRARSLLIPHAGLGIVNDAVRHGLYLFMLWTTSTRNQRTYCNQFRGEHIIGQAVRLETA